MQQYILALTLLFSTIFHVSAEDPRVLRKATVNRLRSTVHNKAESSFSLQATSVVENEWPSGYQVLVTLRNSTSMATTSWQASFTLPAGYMVTSLWNGVKTMNGNTVVVVNNPAWYGGGVIPGNASTTFGMIVAKPTNSQSVLPPITAVANGTVAPPQVPAAPMLQAILIDYW